MTDPGTAHEPIPPALTAEEWRVARADVLAGADPSPVMLARMIALANDALPHGDLRKITREVVKLLRAAAHCCRQDDYYIAAHLNEGDSDATREEGLANRYEAAADALASYLPPEGP